MKKLMSTLLMTVFIVAGCATEEPTESTTDTTSPASVVKNYDLTGTIIGRSAEASTLRIEHQEIGDWMGAMTMTFPVRDAQFEMLPPDGAAITAIVHVSDNGDYWVTGITESAPAEETEAEEGETEQPESDDAAGEGEEISI